MSGNFLQPLKPMLLINPPASQEVATYDPRRLTGVSVYREIEAWIGKVKLTDLTPSVSYPPLENQSQPVTNSDRAALCLL